MALNFLNNAYFAGTVGIGVLAPTEKLEVSGVNSRVTTNSTADGQVIGFQARYLNSSTLQGSFLYSTGPATLAIANHFGGNNANYSDIYFQNCNNGSTVLQTRMTIKGSSGNVGIGTIDPIEKLQVEGKVYVQGNGQNWNETTPGLTRGSVHFDPGTNVANTGNALTFGASDTPGSPNEGSTAQAGIYTRSDGSYGTKMYFATTDSYASGSKTAMMIDYNANVGIGVTSPVQKLSVQGSSTAAAGRFTAGGNTNTLELFGSSTTGQSSGLLVNAGTNTADYAARFRNAGGSVIMNIRGDGNVGIGLTAPTTKLTIQGTHSGTTAARMNIYHAGSQADRNAYLDMWASEPGVTYNGSGIGSNINGTPYYGRKTTSLGMSYIRFVDGVFLINTGPASASSGTTDITNARFTASTDGSIKFNSYNGTNKTGTPTYLLGTDNSGNVVKTLTGVPGSGGTVTGDGVANRITYWDGTNSITSNAGFTYNGFGRVNTYESFGVSKNGANTVADGPFFRLTNAAQDRQYLWQLDAANNIDYWYYNGSTWTQTISLLANGGATFTDAVFINSAAISNQENTTVDIGTETVAAVSTAAFTAAFFDFVIKKGLNVRSGTVYACHNGDTTPLIQFTETSTQDLGDTSDVVLSVDYLSGSMRLLATVVSNGWSVKSLIRAI